MAIRIKSSREGFWRCGKQHGKTAKVWPDDAFNAEELKRLMADDTLTVDIINDSISEREADEIDSSTAKNDDLPVAEMVEGLDMETLTNAQLRDLALQLGMEAFKSNASRVKMLAAIDG